jgi:hypothetical protein
MPKQIVEYKNICSSCGNIWYYTDSVMVKHIGADLENLGKTATACTCFPAAFVPDRKSIDPLRCPKCGSRISTTQKTIHNV